MSFTVNVKRYSTEGGYVSAKAVVGKYGSSSYDVKITGSNDNFIVTYSSGKYAIEIYNPSGYSFSSIDTNLPGFAYGDSLDNGRYYTFTPTNNGSYYVKVYYKPSITYYTVRVRSNISGGNGTFGEYNTTAYDTDWSGTSFASRSIPAGKTIAVEVKGVTGYNIDSVDYCTYGGEISGGKYYLKYGLSSNLDIVVHYKAKTYTVSTGVSPSGGGSVSGGGEYSYGSSCTLTATPNTNYRFTKWSDGSTSATRTFTVTGDTNLTAYFEYIGVQVNISSDGGGTVSVRNTRTGASGTTVYGIIGDTFVFSGTPSNGFHKTYVQLDGSSNQIAYDSNYTINASGTYNFVGHFALNTYTVKVNADSANYYESYYSGGTYNYGTDLQMWAQVNPHYVFHYWQDSNGNKIYAEDQGNNYYIGKITVTGDVTYTMFATPITDTISTTANPADGGSVSGGGEYSYGSDCTLEAVANDGYRFDHWSDGSTENPHTISISGDESYTAYFYANTFNVKLSSSPSNGGTVSGGGTYVNGSVAEIKATPNRGYKFSRWSDGNTSSSRQITVTSNLNLTAYFTKLSYNIEGYPTPDHAGEVDGSDTYYYGERATLTAYPINLHRFLEWSDGDSSNPKKFIVSENVSLAAEFERWPNIFVGSQRVKFIALGGSLIKRMSLGGTDVYLD